MDDEDLTIYKVVVNHEEQYSIWPANREIAPWLARRREARPQSRVPCLHRRGMDRYAPPQFAKANGVTGTLASEPSD